MINIDSRDKKIIANGVFITFNKEDPVTLSFDYKGEKINIEFRFVDDESGSLKVEDDKEDSSIILTFYNFNHTTGSGSISAQKIGKIKNKNLWANVRITVLNKNSPKEVVYTFYLEDKIS